MTLGEVIAPLLARVEQGPLLRIVSGREVRFLPVRPADDRVPALLGATGRAPGASL